MFIEKDNNMNNFWIQCIIKALSYAGVFYDIITFPVYFLIQRPWARRNRSQRVKAKPISSDSTQITYRTADPPREMHLKMVQADIDTLEKVLKYISDTHKDKNCLGTRQVLSEEDELQPNGRLFKKYKMGEYTWRSYVDVEKEACNFGYGIRKLGVQPKDNVVIFSETRAEWMIAAHGLFKHSCSIVTIYATLGDEGIIHGVNETEVSTVITSHELMPKLKCILDKLPKVSTIIYFEDQLVKTDLKGFERIRTFSYSDVIEYGIKNPVAPIPPTKNDVAIIMYTSGSTGIPKGVLITHNNCISTLKCFCDVVDIFTDDVLLGFLPLAHVFELLAESVGLLTGVPIGYSSPNTLIDSSTKIMKGTKGDASILRPTCITAVPLILDRICKGITDKVNKGSPLQKAIFRYCYDYKCKWDRRGYDSPIADHIVFRKISRLLGGKIRLIISGGAPLSAETHEQIRLCLCVEVCQGYGLTETTAASCVMERYDMSYARVGAPSSMVDLRLVNWEEGNYRVTNKPFPQGEIVIGSESVAAGYYKNNELTKENFFEENGRRWFKTGDVGEMHADGVLKIIDRKKDLVKLQAGEYVSLGRVEAEMKTCPIVENICVYCDPSKHYCVALVVPNEKMLMEMAENLNIHNLSFEKLCSSPIIEKTVGKELTEHAKKCKLEKFEIPAVITLCKETWTTEGGYVTAAFKIKRKVIQERYKEEIKRMYAS
ncbi:unnamed protein product [Chironomus riparius]|uniref:long-chain-fatty-acid--CoA ligase n=1 Tax=Chironomus riparius TaxID=315576 RepID=A0A9N9WQ32_9DIPT|nr:unnamed protein product [Chironomus riparius]